VLGYLNPEHLLGGRLKIDRQAAHDAIDRVIAQPLGITPEKAAYGIHSIVNHNMVDGIRRVTIERGHDPRDFVLVGAGGATSLHIAALAREIGIRTVLIPKLASGLCAFGQILSDIKYNLMAACPMRLDGHADLERIERRFNELQDRALALLEKEEGIDGECVSFSRVIDMRYVGQIHECSVSIGSLPVNTGTIGEIRRAFDAMHEQLFTYSEPESEVEIVNIESIALLRSGHEVRQNTPPGGRTAEALLTRRPMIFSADGSRIDTPVYDGDKLGEGDELSGPAVIEEATTTIVVDPGWNIRLDASGTYIMRDQQAL